MKLVESYEPWLGQVPTDWIRSRIRNVATLSPRFSDTPPTADEPCTIVPMELLSEDGLIDVSNQRSVEEAQSGLTLFEQGDVLFAKITPCMENGKGAFVGILPTRYAFGSTEFHVLRPSRKVDGKFLYYATFNPIFRVYAAENMIGAAGHKRVTSRLLRDTRLFLPSLSEQQHIAAYLDASCAAIDAALASKRSQIETLDALQKVLVLKAMTQGLHQKNLIEIGVPGYGATPKHWKKTKLRYEISIQNGDFASDKVQEDGAYAIYGGNGIMGRIDITNVDGETVVIGRVGAYCGNAQYVKGKVWVSDNALIIKSIHNARFLTHLFNMLNFNAQANATAQPVITGTKIKNTCVVLPPLLEQEEICLFIEREYQQLEALRTNLQAQIATLSAYRKSLIHECVTGQRRITDADVAQAYRGGKRNDR